MPTITTNENWAENALIYTQHYIATRITCIFYKNHKFILRNW